MLLLCAYCRRGLGSNMLMPFLCKRRRRPDGKWRKQKAGSKAYAFGGWAAFAAGNIMRFIAMRFAAQTVLSGLGSLQVGALNVPVWACRSRMLPPLHLRTVLRCLWLSQEQAAVSCAAQPASQPHALPPACPQFVIIPIASRFMLGIRASTSTVVGVTIVLLGEMLLQRCSREGAAGVGWPLLFLPPSGRRGPPLPPSNARFLVRRSDAIFARSVCFLAQATCSSFFTAPPRSPSRWSSCGTSGPPPP